MGGLNAADRLAQSGIGASKGTAIYVDPEDVFKAPPDHPLHDPRSLWPADEALARSIDEETVRPTVVVRDDGIPAKSKKRRLTTIDGHQRLNAMIQFVNPWRKKRGEPPRKVEIQIVSGTDAEMLLLRLKLNGQRKDETPSTLAYKIKQGEKAGLTVEQMCSSYGCTVKLAEQVKRFPQCSKRVRDAFDSGALPLDVLGSFVDVPPEEQEAFLDRVVAKLPAGKAVDAKAAKTAVKKAKKQEGRQKPEKRPKSLPAEVLLKAAERLDREEFLDHATLAAALMRAAAGQPQNLEKYFPEIAAILAAVRKGKPAA